LHDGIDDKGWGCAYRTIQTLISWFNELHYYKKVEVPSLQDIQTILVKIGDKPASFVGSSEWIGAMEVSFILKKILGIESKILHISDGPCIKQHL